MFLLLALVFFTGCNSTNNNISTQNPVAYTGEAPEIVLKDYHAYVQKFDQAHVETMRPDFGNIEQSKADFAVLQSLSQEAKALQNRMSIIDNAQDPQINLQVKPYMPIINARVMILKQNIATYQSLGLN